ncbi:hypothetical protein WJX72_003013 [[Myrmecia] bisecta]|uniref:C2 domain-containing protein n=1 Tax=[Myrmecia] bisecta TaxID=41462 RepID=A0AAW1QEJ6_9CHLO
MHTSGHGEAALSSGSGEAEAATTSDHQELQPLPRSLSVAQMQMHNLTFDANQHEQGDDRTDHRHSPRGSRLSRSPKSPATQQRSSLGPSMFRNRSPHQAGAGRLGVRLLCAEGASGDPFATIKCEGQRCRSAVIFKSEAPIWNEFFVFNVGKPETAVLRIKLKNHHTIGANMLLGQLNIPLGPLRSQTTLPQPQWYDLEDDKGQGKAKARVQLQLHYTNGRLERPLQALLTTWNVGNAPPRVQDLTTMLAGAASCEHDFIAVGVQEASYSLRRTTTSIFKEGMSWGSSMPRSAPASPSKPSGSLQSMRSRISVDSFNSDTSCDSDHDSECESPRIKSSPGWGLAAHPAAWLRNVKAAVRNAAEKHSPAKVLAHAGMHKSSSAPDVTSLPARPDLRDPPTADAQTSPAARDARSTVRFAAEVEDLAAEPTAETPPSRVSTGACSSAVDGQMHADEQDEAAAYAAAFPTNSSAETCLSTDDFYSALAAASMTTPADSLDDLPAPVMRSARSNGALSNLSPQKRMHILTVDTSPSPPPRRHRASKAKVVATKWSEVGKVMKKAAGATQFQDEWQAMLQAAVGEHYWPVAHVHMGQIRLSLFARVDIFTAITDVQKGTEATGVGHVGTNKGGVAISLKVWDTSLAFVNSHLAAHQNKTDARNANYHEIVKELKLDRFNMDLLTAFHHVFWMGDLNYRLGYGEQAITLAKTPELRDFEEMVNIVAAGDYSALLPRDQLVGEMAGQRAFLGFQEAPITFPPSFKVDRVEGTVYMSKRSPAWCDRILWRSALPARHAHCLQYFSVPEVATSDHKPVGAVMRVPTFAGPDLSRQLAPGGGRLVASITNVTVEASHMVVKKGNLVGATGGFVACVFAAPELREAVRSAPCSPVVMDWELMPLMKFGPEIQTLEDLLFSRLMVRVVVAARGLNLAITLGRGVLPLTPVIQQMCLNPTDTNLHHFRVPLELHGAPAGVMEGDINIHGARKSILSVLGSKAYSNVQKPIAHLRRISGRLASATSRRSFGAGAGQTLAATQSGPPAMWAEAQGQQLEPALSGPPALWVEPAEEANLASSLSGPHPDVAEPADGQNQPSPQGLPATWAGPELRLMTTQSGPPAVWRASQSSEQEEFFDARATP